MLFLLFLCPMSFADEHFIHSGDELMLTYAPAGATARLHGEVGADQRTVEHRDYHNAIARLVVVRSDRVTRSCSTSSTEARRGHSTLREFCMTSLLTLVLLYIMLVSQLLLVYIVYSCVFSFFLPWVVSVTSSHEGFYPSFPSEVTVGMFRTRTILLKDLLVPNLDEGEQVGRLLRSRKVQQRQQRNFLFFLQIEMTVSAVRKGPSMANRVREYIPING